MDKGNDLNNNVTSSLQPAAGELKKPPNLDVIKPLEEVKKDEDVKVQVVKLSEVKVAEVKKEVVVEGKDGTAATVVNLQMEKSESKTPLSDASKMIIQDVKNDETQIQVLKLPVNVAASKPVIALQIPEGQQKLDLLQPSSAGDETKIIKSVTTATLQIPDTQQKITVENTKNIKLEPSKSSMLSTSDKQEQEDEKTAGESDEKFTAISALRIFALIVVTVLHTFGILIIAFFFSIYQIILSIYHTSKYCYENPGKIRYGIQAAKYAYNKEWWTFKGIYRFLTEPSPPPVFAQRTLSGEIRMSASEKEKLELLRKAEIRKMFHQKRLNGKYTLEGYAPLPPPPQNLELSKKKKK